MIDGSAPLARVDMDMDMDMDMDFGRRVLILPDEVMAKVLRQVPRSVLRAMFAASKELARAARLGVTRARLGSDFARASDRASDRASFDPVTAFPGLRTVELDDDASTQTQVANLLLQVDRVEFVRRWRELSVGFDGAATVLLPHCRDLLRLDLRSVASGDVPVRSLTRLTALRSVLPTLSYDLLPTTLADLTLDCFVAPRDLCTLGSLLTRLKSLSVVAFEVLGPRPLPAFQHLRHFTCKVSNNCNDASMAFLAGAMPRDLESLALLRHDPTCPQISDMSCWTERFPLLSTFTYDLGCGVPDTCVAWCIDEMPRLERLQICGVRLDVVYRVALTLARLSRLREISVNVGYMFSLLEEYRIAFRAGWKVCIINDPGAYVSRWWVRGAEDGADDDDYA